MGTRISSRSFTLEAENKDEDHEDIGNTSSGSAMDVDVAPLDAGRIHSRDHASGEDHANITESEEQLDQPDHDGEEEEEERAEVAMVPFADILNARYRVENVKFLKHIISFRVLTDLLRSNSSMNRTVSKWYLQDQYRKVNKSCV